MPVRGAVAHHPNRFDTVSVSLEGANDVSAEEEAGGPKTQFVRVSISTAFLRAR